MNKGILISEENTLYRYDLTEPPKAWDPTYRSVEYMGNDKGEILSKNQAGLLFFYDSGSTTIKTAELAMKRHNKTEFWLTTASIIKPLRLLDL